MAGKKKNIDENKAGEVANVSRLLRSQSLEYSTPKNRARRSEPRGRWHKKRKHLLSRSNSYERKTNEKRSEARENPLQQRTRSKRSEFIERRREERKRRHAEREERDKAKRRRSDERRKSPLGSGRDVDTKGKENSDNATVTDPKAKITEPQQRTADLLTSGSGGAYIPPVKLRLMQAEITDKASAAYQRIAWEALKKSIHGYINKVNVDNIAPITRDLLKENIVRGRGLLCRSIIQAQAASPTFTHVYAALMSIINSKFPNIGELLLKRLIIQFKQAFQRSDKPVCLSSTLFIAHLINQRVAHEILALEILTLLVETPNDNSVEVAISFLKECGMKLSEVSSKGIGAIFEMLKNILHEGKLDKRVQYMIEVGKDGFKDHQSVIETLKLVKEDDQCTHMLMLDDAIDPEEILNAFKFDEQYAINEDKYKGLSREILGSDASTDEEGDKSSKSDTDGDSSADSDNDEEVEGDNNGNLAKKSDDIIDNTETNLIALRRTIYLTINSSLEYEECAHKLMKMQLKPGQEIELCHMFLDCCAEQRTYEKFYGLLAERVCSINKIYIEPFEEIFRDTYQTTHRLDTNRLRNVSKFFAHLLFTDAISWNVLECIKLNKDETSSCSRIFVKILFQELAEYMGLPQLNKRLKDEVLVESLTGLFPKDNPRNIQFSIKFFTSIGLGGLTDELIQFLNNAPKPVPAINAETLANKPSKDESSSETSSSSSSTSSDSDDSSESDSSSSSSTKSLTDSSSTASDKKKSKKKIKVITKKKNHKEASTNSEKDEGKNKREFIKRSGKNEKIKKTEKKNKKESNSSSTSSATSSSQSSSSSRSGSHSSVSSNSSSSESHNNAGKFSTKQQWKNKTTEKKVMAKDKNEEGFAPKLRKVSSKLKENGFEAKLYKQDEQERERELIRRREEREKRHRVREKYEETYRQRERERAARKRKRTRTRSRSRSRSRLLDKKRSSLRRSRSRSSHNKRNQHERERERDHDRDRDRERAIRKYKKYRERRRSRTRRRQRKY